MCRTLWISWLTLPKTRTSGELAWCLSVEEGWLRTLSPQSVRRLRYASRSTLGGRQMHPQPPKCPSPCLPSKKFYWSIFCIPNQLICICSPSTAMPIRHPKPMSDFEHQSPVTSDLEYYNDLPGKVPPDVGPPPVPPLPQYHAPSVPQAATPSIPPPPPPPAPSELPTTRG